MSAFYGPEGEKISTAEAQRLLLDVRSRLLAEDTIPAGDEVVLVATWFTVIDHGPSETGKPLLWETVVSGADIDEHIQRYTSRAAAERGHHEIVSWITNRLARKDREPPGTDAACRSFPRS